MGVPGCLHKITASPKGDRTRLIATILLRANCSLREKTSTSRRKAYEHRDVGIQIKLIMNIVHRKNQPPTVGSVEYVVPSLSDGSLHRSTGHKLQEERMEHSGK